MKTVIMTSGPRGAGKSTYCKKVLAENPDIHFVSRDEILMEKFGKTSLSGYSGGHYYAFEIMWGKIEQILVRKSADLTLIVDCWNGASNERACMVRRFLEYGADEVCIWYFTTPLRHCATWFANREHRESGESLVAAHRRCIWDHSLYHKLAEDLKKGAHAKTFVREINAAQLLLPRMPVPVPL